MTISLVPPEGGTPVPATAEQRQAIRQGLGAASPTEAQAAAASAVAGHESAANPHPQYLTQAQADTLYATQQAVADAASQASAAQTEASTAAAAASAAGTAATAANDAAAAVAAGLSGHEQAADPHSQYLDQARGDARYALLASLAAAIRSEMGAALIGDGGIAVAVDAETGAITLSYTPVDGGATQEPPVDLVAPTVLTAQDHANRYLFVNLAEAGALTFPDELVPALTNGMEFYGVNIGPGALSFSFGPAVQVQASALLPASVEQNEPFSFVCRGGVIYRTA